MTPFLICKFEKQTLTNLVKESFGSEFPEIYNKKQIDYIWRYLRDLSCQTVLLESEYIDHDYLEDYTRYYVRGFNNSGYKCARLHFFSYEFDHENIDLMLQSGNTEVHESLRRHYLGFVIIKPLPKTFIGRTCLKIYDSLQNSEEKTLLTRQYEANLFGINLVVNSIAFQEQDKVVAACSSTSVWSALHAIPWKKTRDIPSRSEITSNAINHIDGSSNSFPNKELTNKQILRAIDSEKLRHIFSDLHNYSWDALLKVIKIHIDSALPLILGAQVYSIDKNNTLKHQGGHAVTVLGYKEQQKKPALYVHDDRLGPFVRASFVKLNKFTFPDELSAGWGVVIQEKNDRKGWKNPHEVLIPNSLISLKHPKVRISYSYPLNTCELIKTTFQQFVAAAQKNPKDKLETELTYTIRLQELSSIKESYSTFDFNVEGGNPPGIISELQKDRADFLSKNNARFQWVCSFFFTGKTPIFDLLFDATDIPQGSAVTAILEKNKQASMLIYHVLGIAPPAIAVNFLNNEHFYSPLKNMLNVKNTPISMLNEKNISIEVWLDHTYGKLRAPKYLKAEEFNANGITDNASVKKFYGVADITLSEFMKIAPLNTEHHPQLIWAIAHDGALLMGIEYNNQGHPCLTGFKPARIAGELFLQDGKYYINSKSGRYSRGYNNTADLLGNAIKKFRSTFSEEKIQMTPVLLNEVL
ncbi:hypothetical protein DVP60_20910 [Yersinia enterocolitica]|uniref:hypothetical protein n=1 Tax=Yersinia enterocolitica TaxID=630 RepID=UPI0021E93527|nr:hypothetical protein [Yersinia enterocolitica]EKN3949051.1 hypothetical protein [Yersinia enterocolitica]EKN6318677.1 hypothetical protein [Yersinia enterocolitica]UYJ98510.1 hypothetical protein N4W06_05450 [Yersinia enterocolitica]